MQGFDCKTAVHFLYSSVLLVHPPYSSNVFDVLVGVFQYPSVEVYLWFKTRTMVFTVVVG